MTEGGPADRRKRTAAVLNATAEQLRSAAVRLFGSAGRARDSTVEQRLRALGDRVVREAESISRRAARLAGRQGNADAAPREDETPEDDVRTQEVTPS